MGDCDPFYEGSKALPLQAEDYEAGGQDKKLSIVEDASNKKHING